MVKPMDGERYHSRKLSCPVLRRKCRRWVETLRFRQTRHSLEAARLGPAHGGERRTMSQTRGLTTSPGPNDRLGPVLAPRPAGGEIGHNRLHAVLLPCWSNMPRLLKIPIVARAGTASTSSCIDRLGGEFPASTRKIPPDFCARAAVPDATEYGRAPATARCRRSSAIACPPAFAASESVSRRSRRRFLSLADTVDRQATFGCAEGKARRKVARRLFNERDVFHPMAVVDRC